MKKAFILITLFFLVPPSVSRGDYHKALKNGDYKAALNELIPLAEKGDASARDNLGLMYAQGQGVPQDYAEAVRWFRKAAYQGYANAQNDLGTMYLNGQGITQDYDEAVKWYRKAADQGEVNAQYNLGILYFNGQGVPQDYVQAHMWYDLATAQGNKDASEIRETIAQKMTPDQIDKAQRLAREFTPKLEKSKP
ncbi:MAG: tetratricopeptide repeat protein [Desulfomonilia bacterium]